MNSSIKKILYVGLPIIIIMIAISLTFYIKANQFSTIRHYTSDSELLSFSIVENSFKSEETVDSTEDNKQYQTKVIIELFNMAKYDLEYFDISLEFIESENDEIWTYTQKDFSLYGDNKLIITSTRPYEAISIKNVYVVFDSNDENKVYIYSTNEYKELYGENNVIISPTTLKIYNVLTIASILFTIVITVTIALLIFIYTKPEEDITPKVSARSQKTNNKLTNTLQNKDNKTNTKNSSKNNN